MATNYQRGYVFERRVMKALTDEGYFCVRSGGSHTPVDIVALDRNVTILIQCKKDGVISDLEWNELFELAQKCNVKAYIAFVESRGAIGYTEINRIKKGSRSSKNETGVQSNQGDTGKDIVKLQQSDPKFLLCD